MLTRRQLFARSMVGGAGLALGGSLRAFAAAPPLTPYVDALPIPRVVRPAGVDAAGNPLYRIGTRQITQRLHSQLPPTTLWGYGDWNGATGVSGASSPGPSIVVTKGQPVSVAWYNGLPARHLFPTDDPLIVHHLHELYPGVAIPPVRNLPHVHGGRVSAEADGNPYATPLTQELTPGRSRTLKYANDQDVGTAWYHEHAIGATRTNVYAGLAGAYVITDPSHGATGLPDGARDIPLVIQDRLVDRATGALIYPGPGVPPGRSWIPEFFGDVVMVNGRIWPYLEVEPRRYRFRLLNGSQARIYDLRMFANLSGVVTVAQVAGDLGYLRSVHATKDVCLAPGERAEVVVDFAGLAGENVELRNTALPPGVVSPAPALARDGIMQFRVRGRRVSTPAPTLPARPALPAASRRIVHTLEEVMDPATGFPLMALCDGKLFHDPLSDADRIARGTTVEFDLVNVTADTHPIHLHLVEFELVDRQAIDVPKYLAALTAQRTNPANPADVFDRVTRSGYRGWMSRPLPAPGPFLKGRAVPAPPSERGPKDTVRANPGTVTRIRATFTLPPGAMTPAKYVWHCHILEHEENDMMRPYEVR